MAKASEDLNLKTFFFLTARLPCFLLWNRSPICEKFNGFVIQGATPLAFVIFDLAQAFHKIWILFSQASTKYFLVFSAFFPFTDILRTENNLNLLTKWIGLISIYLNNRKLYTGKDKVFWIQQIIKNLSEALLLTKYYIHLEL